VPYFRCPNCGLLVHLGAEPAVPTECSRCCLTLEEEVELVPFEESMRQVGSSVGRSAESSSRTAA
jgi:hypothetical protein